MNFKKIKLFLGMVFAVSVFGFLVSSVSAAPNISSAPAEHWAWNDVIGWIDFYSTDKVEVTSQKIKGYAGSSVGYIAFDCVTSPNLPANCSDFPNWKVTNNGNGDLSGWAWSDAIGWISFDNVTAGSPYLYQVRIDAGSNFYGWAWNDVIGWISFNCNNSNIGNTCASGGGYDYKVKTNWSATAATGTLLSSIFDTGIPGGVGFNSIMWQGSLLGGTVKFQFASSNSTSTFPNPIGPDGTSGTTYNPTGPGNPVALIRLNHNNHRYYRYKIILESDFSQTISPRVDDVIVNWSP